MNEGITVQQMMDEIKRLDAQKELLLKLVAMRKGEGVARLMAESPSLHTSGGSSVRGRIIDAVIELIHKNGRQVTNKEVLAYVEEKQLSLGNMKNKVTGLGAILSQEAAKKTARIKQVKRGVYDLK